MSESSLVPETPLTFSPGLAATIGLEEAILLQHLHNLQQHRPVQRRGSRDWLQVERALLLHQLPFWSVEQLQRICRSLVDKGILLVDSYAAANQLVFALNEQRKDPATAQNTMHRAAATSPLSPMSSPSPLSTPPPEQHARAGLLPATWAPSEDMLQLLALNHNIPRQFALAQLEDFILYWRERGEISHAWDNKFRQHVLSQWRRSQQQEAERFNPQPDAPLDHQWRPNADAMEILLRAGVQRSFIEEAIPEFVLYWRERGSQPKELNSRFVQHIRLQWTRYSSSLQHSTEPQRIAPDWTPSEDVFDILRLSHIERGFALSLLPEFIVYWRDSNQLHTSWNSKFLQHVKYHWARQNNFGPQRGAHEGQQATGGAGRTRDRSLEQDLSDTSWAD